ncbi:MAG: tetratricopeptide repeat protein, partial [Simkaniaceae bacterium]|nr:tetratricopeptide repeat protein [Simkaniaceae bacterium]
MLKPKLLILLFACLSLCAEPNVRVHEPWSSSLSQENVDRWKQFTINREGLSAIELCDLADALIKSHKYPQAEAVLLQLETRDEMPFYSRAQLGFVYSWQKRNAEASEQFLDALKVKPCNDEVTAGLREVAGQLRLEEPTREEAIASYRALLKCNPDNAEELFFLGQLLSWTGKWVEAEKLLKRSLEIDPGYSDAEIQLGLLYFWQRRYTKAEEILYRYPRTPAANEAYLKIQEIFEARSSDDRVVTSPPLTPQVYADDERQIEIEKAEVEADPEDADARTRLARLYMLTGQLELARQTLLKSVELDPNLYASRVQLGYLYLTFKEYDLAYTEFTEAARLGGCEQELVNGYYEVAFEFMKDPKRIDQTEKILRQLMRCQPSNWAFMVDYGKLLEYQGQTKEAEAYYRKALRRNDSSVYAKLELAQLYVNLGDLEPAKKIYDSLPDERGAEIGLEKIQLIEGNYPTQDEIEYYPLIVKHPMYFDHTSRLGPAIEKVDSLPLPKAMRLYYLARLYLMIGDLDRAQSALRNAVRVNPGYVDAHTQLGYVYMWQKDYKRAGFQFEKAFSLQKCNADAVRGMIELGQEVVLEPSFHNYAIYLYEKAATCRRLTADENYQLGRLYAWNGKWELAEERLLEAITQDKKHKLATEQLGNLYLWQFRLDEAKDMFGRFPLELTFQRGVERSEFIQSDYTELLRVTLAQVISVPIPNYQYAKLFEKEIEEFKEANPGYWEDPSKLFTLAQLNLLAGNNNTARNLLFEMTLIDPDSIDARLQLGYSYLWEQNYHQAFNYFTEVLKQSPCNDLAIAGYEQLGQAWNQRRPTYKKALGIYNTLRA